MKVRVADSSDLNRVMDIEKRAHAYPWSEKIMLRYLQKKDSVWILEVNDEHVAHAVISRAADESELLMISVDPDQQGKKYGSFLLKDVIQRLKSEGINFMFLEVRESNAPAIALYESLDFAETGRRNNYYPTATGREDALMYSLELCD